MLQCSNRFERFVQTSFFNKRGDKGEIMERNNISTFKRMLLVISITGTFLYANIIPAHKAKKISYSSTQKVIKEFMSNKKTLSAYKEVEKYADKRIRETANGGFYNIVRIKIDDINTKTKNMKFNKLSKKQKDILKYFICIYK